MKNKLIIAIDNNFLYFINNSFVTLGFTTKNSPVLWNINNFLYKFSNILKSFKKEILVR